MWSLLFFPLRELLEGRHRWWLSILRLRTAPSVREMLSTCGVDWIAKQKVHAADGDFDWPLILTHVVTLSNSEDVFLHKFAEILCLLGLTIWHINSFGTEYGSILPLPPSHKNAYLKAFMTRWSESRIYFWAIILLSVKVCSINFHHGFVWYVLGQQRLWQIISVR